MYERAIEIDPEDLYPLVALSGLLVLIDDKIGAMSKYAAVLELTDRAIRSGHSDHWIRFARGEAFVAYDDVETARCEFEHAMEYNPPPGDVQSEKEQLEALLLAEWRVDAITRAMAVLEGRH